MTTLCDCPESRLGEWSFCLFGIPVRVKFWFWIAVILLGGEQEPPALLIWVAVCFSSILLHEFGHVWAFRAFGTDAEAVLYGWGGLAIPDREPRGTLGRFVVALSGPAAGFCAAALALAAARVSGAAIRVSFHMFLPAISAWPAMPGHSSYYWYLLLNDLLFANFYWGLVNLLPVYPLDGGQASRAVFEQRDPYRGKRHSLILSTAVAAAFALVGLVSGSLYLAFLFGIMAVSSAQALAAERRSAPRPSWSWR